MFLRTLKVSALAGALTAGVCASSVAAEAQGWYAGVSAGYAQNKVSGINFIPGTSQKNSDTGFKLFGGYQFSPNWAVELEAVNFGKFKADSSLLSSRVKASAFGASVVGNYPLSSDFSVFGKLGAAAKFTKVDESSTGGAYRYSQKKISGNILAGAGAEYQLSKQVSLRAEYEYFGKTSVGDNGGKLTNSMASLGLRYSF
jgi:OOP family OmpA-OmpF porin